MAPLRKIDYRQLTSEAPNVHPEEEVQQEKVPEEARPSPFVSLRNRWFLMGNRTKLEVVAFIVVIIVIIVVLSFYFSQRKRRYKPEEMYAPPAIEEFEEP